MILYCPRCGTEFPHEFLSESFGSARQCPGCRVAVADLPAMLAPSEAEITYGLDEWPVEDRAALTDALAADEIPYRWEAGGVLAVPEVVEEVVDGLLDELEESADGGDIVDEGDLVEDGGEEAQAAMAELFVAADRLYRAPEDQILAAQLSELSDVVAECLPPYGIDEPAWRRIGQMAAEVSAATDVDEIAGTARALRDHLRAYV